VLSIFVDNEPGLPPLSLDPHDKRSKEYKGVPFQVGRLNPVPAITELANRKSMYRGHVFVCGPPGLAATADLACLQNGLSFHKEVFAF
jgi:hypothetical protein